MNLGLVQYFALCKAIIFLGRPKFVTSNIGTTKYIDAHLRLTNINHKPVFT
jgi:hypothetical protein